MKSISIYRLNAIFLFFILSGIVLFYGKDFLIPLLFAILFAMLLLPVCNKLEKWGWSRIWSSITGALIILLFLGGIVAIIAAQGSAISDQLPQMQERGQKMLEEGQKWVQEQYGINPQQQAQYAQKGLKSMAQSGGSFFTNILSWIMDLLTSLVLVLLYFFFIMWKREKYKEFILKLVEPQNRQEVSTELDEISKVSGMYLVGRMISFIFLAVFYMIGFSIVGLENGLLLALVAVLPTIVPYIGAFVGGFFPLAYAIISGSPDTVIPVAVILVLAQIIDNNIIEPLAEGESMDISPIFTIISIVIGELVWGVAGMILFIPLFAIIKIVCDHIPSLHPYGFLLTNDVDEPKWVESIKNFFSKKK